MKLITDGFFAFLNRPEFAFFFFCSGIKKKKSTLNNNNKNNRKSLSYINMLRSSI
jgi:hypothetical protein